MANTLAALKTLLCPAGDSCTAFQCLFSHPRDNSGSNQTPITSKVLNNQNTSKVSTASRAHPSEDNKDSTSEDRQRKRIKLDVDSTAVSLPRSSVPTSSSKMPSSKQRKEPPVDTSATIQKDGSPSILIPNSSPPTETSKRTLSQQAEHRQSSIANPAAPTDSPSRTPVTQPKQPRKGPESLNPRLLKKAPASHPTRVALVKALHKEFQRLNDELKKTAQGVEKKWLLSEQELIVKTLDEEQEIAIKKTAIYNTAIRNKILTYKKMSMVQWKDERSKVVQSTNHNSTEPASTTPIERIETGLTLPQELEFLSRLVYDLAPLAAHGYISKIPSKEDIEAAKAGVRACGNTETCDRCTRRFQVFPGRREADGALASNGPCTYHPGKSYFLDRSRTQRRFKCCQRSHDDEAGGCMTAQHHVFKTTDPKRLAAVLNFVNTPPNPGIPKDRAVSFDCEMGYTVYGLELIRLTVVSWPAGDTLLDILVRPVGEVLDLNTRFSGVRPEDLASAEQCDVGSDHQPNIIPTSNPTAQPERRLKVAASPKIARDILFTIISAETPLIGHGLENDLNAARIIHPTCIDTVLLWPHSRGLPMRNGLKYLMETKLGRKIQVDPTEGAPEGHDSAEDARAAGDLVRLKIRDEWKTMQMKGWTVGNAGELLAPSEDWTIVGGAKTKKH
ncbi:hypothetical protein FHL15_003986 [Xylaria flabelliformis]|uniref:Exonuclease domain-containing protein n=1 Tax=Xylaria flabelliformis TaxID=2512241 RepID=A0A553I517_9PEZI|nr:hypothetical protein FHL15_003986 [Xylaria flabelliformis]